MPVKIKLVLIYVILGIFVTVSIIPFYWSTISSFKPRYEIFENPSIIIKNFTLANYDKLFTETLYLRWFLNSIFVASVYTLLVLFFCSLAGFAFAKYSFPGKKALFLIILASMIIPIWMIILPLFIWFSRLGLMNTYWALILPGSANAFGIFLMRQYIQGVPSEIIDSARIDGCSEFRIYFQIVLPIIKPALGALGIFAFLFSWNNFISPVIFMRSVDMYTLPIGLASFIGQKNPEYAMLMAGGIISVIPLLFVFLRLQKQLVAGLTLGAVKE